VGKRGNHLVATVTTSRNILVSLFSFACFGKHELEAKIEFELSNSSKKFRIFFLIDLCGHGLPIVAFLEFTHLIQVSVKAKKKKTSKKL
jgi:hypothetical protein